MLTFFTDNLGTIIIGAIILAIIALIIISMRKNKKNGKTSCGCGCSNCPSAELCHKKVADK